MFKNYNRYNVLKVFLDSPTEGIRLREISRLSGVPPKSVMNYLRLLEAEQLVKKIIKKDIPFYFAKRDEERFKLYQRLSIQYELVESGFVETLWDKLSPEAIILYGSYAKGEAIETSDIDIFVIGKEIGIELKEYNKKMGKEIHLMFNPNPKKIPEELKNNLINGIVLKGYFKVF